MLWLNPITKPEFRFRGGRGQTMFHQSQNFSFLFVSYSRNLTKSQSKIMTKMTKSRSVLKFFIVLVKPSWACSWDSHEHLCSWKVHEHAHEAFTRTCAWSCHGQDHFIELCLPGGSFGPRSYFQQIWTIFWTRGTIFEQLIVKGVHQWSCRKKIWGYP